MSLSPSLVFDFPNVSAGELGDGSRWVVYSYRKTESKMCFFNSWKAVWYQLSSGPSRSKSQQREVCSQVLFDAHAVSKITWNQPSPWYRKYQKGHWYTYIYIYNAAKKKHKCSRFRFLCCHVFWDNDLRLKSILLLQPYDTFNLQNPLQKSKFSMV